MIETHWLRARDGVTVGVRTVGTQGAAVIFVHGVGSNAAIWDYQLGALQGQNRCFAVELRGNGATKSEPPPELIDREGFVDDVLAVADANHLPLFHFVGCSLGGVVGFELWRRAPERVASFTMLGSFAKYPKGKSYAKSIIEAVKDAKSMEAFAKERAHRVLPPNPPEHRVKETIEQMAGKSKASYIASTQATWTGDYRSTLGTISIPTMVVCGALDQVAPLEFSQSMARDIPHAQIVAIPDAAHCANADAPERFNAILSAFISV